MYKPCTLGVMRISSDGLIRLSIEELLSTPISHFVSGVDLEGCQKLSSCGKATSISGYTEWVSKRAPIISIGWDWCIRLTSSGPLWTRVGLPRSNVMLVDATDGDADWEKNLEILATVVDALPWREHLLQAVAAPYAQSPSKSTYKSW